MKIIIRWILLVFVMLLVVFNYEAFIEIIDRCLLVPLNQYAHSSGYAFDLEKQLSVVLEKFIPAVAVIGFVIETSKKDFRDRMKILYDKITNFQLFLLSLLLPLLLFVQNKFFSDYISTYYPNNKPQK